MERWAGYIRVSRTSEDGMSPGEQRDKILQFAAPHGIEVQRWFEDLDVSGSRMRRKQFNRLMTMAANGEVDGVIVARVSRFGRTLVGALAAIEQLGQYRVRFKSATEPVGTTTSTERFLLNQMLVIAEWELDRIRENWQYYTGAAIDRGVHISHGTHYGYYKVAKEEDRAKAGTLVIRPEEAAVVKDIFRRRAQDQTYSGIAEWLNDEHPRPDGKRWHHQNIKRIIQNRIYTGEAFRGKRVNKDAHPCIVTDAEWRAANAVGDRRARRATDPELPILAGLLRCAGCRYAMRQVTSKYRTKDGKQHAIRSYVCGKKHGGGVCQSPAYVKAEDIESWVVFTFLYWYGESTRNPHAGRAVQDAEAKLAEASRRLREVMENDVLREAAPKAHLEDVVRRQRLVDEATEELIAARATVERQAPSLLALDWEDADTPTRHNLLTRGLDSIYIRRGDGPLMDRVWFCWQDDADRPVRGRSDYLLRPIEWPEPVTADELAATFISHGVDPVRAAIYAQSIVGGSSMAAANYPEWAPPHVERYGFVPADTQRALGYG